MPKTTPNRVRVGEFELNLDTGELAENGEIFRLAEKPLRILITLIEHSGQLVKREDLQRRLWPNDTIVDFEHGINTAIKLLRKMLGDSVEAPRYIETIPRRGYRLIVPVTWMDGATGATAPDVGINRSSDPRANTGDMSGRVVSHYRVLELIGGGGMGVVYCAEDLKLGRTVAMKFLSEELGRDPIALERFHREARAVSILDHPNICPIYEFGEQDGQPFLVMPLLKGRILRDRLAECLMRAEPFPMEELLAISLDVSAGLQEAHQNGIIHRDIKPANIFLTCHGHAKILDFGVAKSVDPPEAGSVIVKASTVAASGNSSELTSSETCLGTLPYMSPEQAAHKELDARTDLFSFGVVLCEMATGSLALSGGDPAGIFKAITDGKPVQLVRTNPHSPPELERIVNKALERDPSLRYQTAAEMRADLSRLKRKTGNEDSTQAAAAPEQSPSAKRRRSLPVLFAIGTTIALAVVMVWLWRTRHPQHELTGVHVKVVPLTTYPGIEQHPSLSPDGTQVAFSWNGPDEANFDIYVKTTSAKTLSVTPLRLTTDPTDDIDPVWSPDGSSIAFLRKTSTANTFSVLLIPALGGPERKLTDVSIPEVWWLHLPFLSWTPDSRNLVITDRPSVEHPTALYLLSIATGEKRQLTSPPAGVMGDSCAAVSPDGTMLAFRRANAAGTWKASHYVLGLNADWHPEGKPTQVSLEPGPIDANSLDKWSCATWTADSRRLIFSYDLGLWTLPVSISDKNPAQEKATLAIETGSEVSGTSVSRTSTRLAYALRTGGNNNIWRLRIAGPHETPTRFIASAKSDFAEQYSPDGSKIAFESDRGGNLEIWICGSNGQNCTQLTQLGASATGIPAWSPDGKQIAFYSNASGTSQIYVMPADGGVPRRLTSEPAGAMAPRWSRNGVWIYFSSKKAGSSQIWKVRSTGGESSQVTHGAGFVCSESPDGKWLYFAEENSIASLWKIPVNGSQEEQVLPSVSAWNFAVLDDGIYFVTKAGHGFAIKFLAFATGKIEVIAAIDDGYFGFSVSPDRKWILYNQNVPASSQLFLAEGFK